MSCYKPLTVQAETVRNQNFPATPRGNKDFRVFFLFQILIVDLELIEFFQIKGSGSNDFN